ncbi:hypothetical protein EB796_000740 [Bugula neritina]|uniref:Uncharacterized protein n=1 Tax=Bugula neritina TaxID=10212 RepID=A0A7J7KS03_BUGNE|nr:hypothetical protein EB796_000740 [Bugula neritina]
MHISLQFLAFKPRSKSVGDGDSGVALSLSSSLKSSSYDADHLDSTSSQVKSDRFQYSQSHDTTVSSSSIPGAPTANSPPSLSLHTKPMNTPVAPLYSVNTPSVPLCVVSKVNAHPVFDDITSNFTLVPDISDGLDRLSVQSVDTPRTEDFEQHSRDSSKAL